MFIKCNRTDLASQDNQVVGLQKHDPSSHRCIMDHHLRGNMKVRDGTQSGYFECWYEVGVWADTRLTFMPA